MNADELVRAYCTAWDEPDVQRRVEILNDVWAEDGTYIDPNVHIVGRTELVAHIGRVLARYPGSRIELTSLVDVHHGMLRFTWQKILADGTSLPEGTDFGEISSDSKLRLIVGFFGPPRPTAKNR